uniref:Uncharacterized protein n=1 Tax=Ditylenchus dipsaci TaxID=166011 RepID=A0A915CYL9_9BILA
MQDRGEKHHKIKEMPILPKRYLKSKHCEAHNENAYHVKREVKKPRSLIKTLQDAHTTSRDNSPCSSTSILQTLIQEASVVEQEISANTKNQESSLFHGVSKQATPIQEMVEDEAIPSQSSSLSSSFSRPHSQTQHDHETESIELDLK